MKGKTTAKRKIPKPGGIRSLDFHRKLMETQKFICCKKCAKIYLAR